MCRWRLRAVEDIDEQDLEQLFTMIDQDSSGTIEVAEFIGPLSRWAHDSKTAPRFIKYNMIQTMHLQEDLYDLSVECFRLLAARIDELACHVQGVKPTDAGGMLDETRSEGTATVSKATSLASVTPTQELKDLQSKLEPRD